jgi:hypothetical protein
MLHSALRRLQIRASQASEKELRRAALWSALLVLGIPAITFVIYSFTRNPVDEGPRWLDIFTFAVSLPNAPGYLVAGGITRISWAIHGPPLLDFALVVISTVSAFAVNWYLYFVLFAIWINRRNRAKEQRANAQGASPNVA